MKYSILFILGISFILIIAFFAISDFLKSTEPNIIIPLPNSSVQENFFNKTISSLLNSSPKNSESSLFSSPSLNYTWNGPCNIIRSDLIQYIEKQSWIEVYPTGSMKPCISDSIKEIKVGVSYSYNRLMIGDVVYFNLPSRYCAIDAYGETHCADFTIHRIIAQTSEGFITKGDASEHNDYKRFGMYLTPENYKGIAIDAR